MEKHFIKAMKSSLCLILAFCLLLCLFAQDAIVLKANAAEAQWLWPAKNCYIISSNFGNRGTSKPHTGIDIIGSGTTFGQPVVAAKSGTVHSYCNSYGDYESTSPDGMKSYGNYVIIKHDDGKYTIYAHMRQNGIKTSGTVKQGDVIGYIGDSGNSSGPHLHFQIFTDITSFGTSSLNPMPTNSNITILNEYSLPSGWASQKQTYIFEVAPTGYTISFNANGGSCSTVRISVPDGEEIGTMPAAIRSGYIFDGWYTSASGGSRVYEDYVFSSDITLYAHWRNDYVTLGDHFYAFLGHMASDYGIINASSNVELGDSHSAESLWEFTRQTDGSYEIVSTLDGNALDVYDAGIADWTNVWVYPDNDTLAQRWFIRQVGDGYVLHSALSGKALDVYYGSTDSQIGDNVQIYTANDSVAQLMFIDTPWLEAGVDSLSMLTGVSHGLTISLRGAYHGSWYFSVSDSADILDYRWGSHVDKSCDLTITPNQSGSTTMTVYLYDAFSLQRVSQTTVYITVSDTYTVTFDALNGLEAETITVNAGEYGTVPSTIPFNLGYTFLGWGSKYFDTVMWEPGSSIYSTASTTVYAKYQEAETIGATTTFTSQHVSPIYPRGIVWYKYVPSVTTSYEIKSIDETVDNYVFVYDADGNLLAYDDDNGDDLQFKTACEMTAGETYYIGVYVYNNPVEGFSFYIDRGFAIYYHANGGVGTLPVTYVYCGDGGTLSSTIPSRSGYTFKGWATNASATEAEYSPGQYVNIDANTVLYAVWESSSYTISYDANGGTGAPSSQTKLHDVDLTLSTTVPQRFGYTFLGWRASSWSTGNGVYFPGGTYTETFGTTMRAIWGTAEEINSATIHSDHSTSIDFVNQYRYYTFTPDHTGMYTFESTGNRDTRIYLYDSNGTQLAFDDDAGSGNNFLLTHELTGGTQYYFKVNMFSNGTGTINFSINRSLPAITQHPANITVNEEQSATFTVAATGTNLTYQWQFKPAGDDEWFDNPCTGSTLTITPAYIWRNGYQYRCAVTDAYGNAVYSDAATLTVTPAITIITQPTNQTATAGNTANFSIVASGSYLTYQWQHRTSPSGTWANATAPGNRTATLSVPATMSENGYQYRCVLSNGISVVYSDTVTLTVNSAITITQHPANITVNEEQSATFTVAATGTNLTYQWQFKPAGDDEWFDNFCTSATLTLSPAYIWRNGYQYRCAVTDAYGNAVYSDAATLTVTPAITIITQPTNQTATAGNNANFSIAAGGSNISYQWQYRTSPSGTWANAIAPGNQTATLSVPATMSKNGYQYRCMLSNGRSVVYSDTVTLTVRPAITITKQPTNVTTTAAGKATFTVAATGTGLTYQWQFRAKSTDAWANNTCKSATLTFNPAAAWRNGYQYRCVITDAKGNKAYSNAATLTIGVAVSITKQPTSVTTTPAGKATFTVAATGTGLTYQWQFRAKSTDAWANNACKTATLTFNPAEGWRNGYQYRCVITDATGNKAYSNTVTLTVVSGIIINTQPTSVTVAPTGKATFTVVATGTGLSYQWQFRANSSAAWANNACKTPTLTFNPAEGWRNGYQYRCVITDVNGNKVYSNVATLTVK